MKKILLTLATMILAMQVFSQATQAFKYQAVARVNGQLMENQVLTIQLSILKDGQPVFSEIHSTTTNEFGLFSLNVGMGVNANGDFDKINWGDGIYSLKMEVNGEDFPESQILAVPLAIHASSASRITGDNYSDQEKSGLPFWTIWGNSNTKPDEHFLGTINEKDLVVKVNSTEAIRIKVGEEMDVKAAANFIETARFEKEVSFQENVHAGMDLRVDGSIGVGKEPEAKLDVNGSTRTKILEITGGSDLSEGFDIPTTSESIVPEPGMLVSIDPANPGQLMISRESYDKKLAGVISGANGIKPGMVMGKEGTLVSGRHPVALAGRVYVWADASKGAIEPGDMLTSSPTAGYAMKVGDFEKAQGAVIGKAMTSLEDGKGLVLILIRPQ